MSRSTTAREALIAEAIGDVANLLDRVEALAPAMNSSHRKLADAAIKLGACVEPFKAHIAEAMARTQNAAVEHIRRRTGEIAAESLRQQTQAMEEAARAIVAKEIGPPLRQLASALQVLVERTRRPQWETWATYAATGCVSATAAVWITLLFVHC